MSRTLSQSGLGKARTLTGLSNDNIDTIKEKYDFDGTIQSGTLLIGSSTGNYTANELTAGANITITNGTGQDAKGTITIASSQLVLNAGTNLSKTTSINGDITINLDAVIGGMTSVNGFTLVSNISSAANQFLLKDNSVGGFANGTFLSTNSSGLIVPTTQTTINSAVQNTILGGNNITKNTASGNATLNLNAVISGMTSVNGFTLVSNTSSAANQFLLKDASVGGFPNNGFLTINGNGLVQGTTQDVIKTFIHSSILGGNNITKNTAGGNLTINLNPILTGLTSIDGTSDLPLKRAGVEKIKLETTKVEFKENSSTLGANLLLKKGSGNQDNNADYEIKQEYTTGAFRSNRYEVGVRFHRYLSSSNFIQFFCGFQQDEGQSIWLNPNNDLHYIFRSGVLKIRKPDDTSHNFSIQLGNNASTFTMTSLTSANFDCDTFKFCKSRFQGIRSGNNLFLFNASAQQAVVGNNLNFLEQNGDGSLLKLRGTTIKLFSTTNEIISLNNTAIISNRKIGMEQNPINLYASTDTNHQILYSNDSSTMNGVLIRGFGNDVPFFRLQGTAGGTHNVLDAYITKINLNRKIVIQPSTDIYTNDEFMLHIKPFQGKDCRVCIESDMNNSSGESHNPSLIFKQDGGGIKMEQGINAANQFYFFHPQTNSTWSRFRFHCGSTATDSNGQPTTASLKLSIEKEKVIIYKPLVFDAGISDTAQIDYNNAKQLSVNIVEGGEFRIDSGNSNYFKTIAQGGGANGRTFFFEQGGDDNQSNGGTFQCQCSQGKLKYQSDRNLVIYRPDDSVSYASGGNASSRDYKKNIVDLVESDSINVIKNINPVSYEYKENYWDSIDQCDSCNCNLRKGFIWEDIKPILPQSAKSINMNNPDMEMTKLLDTKEIIPDLVKTIQYLINKVETLEQQINK